ncbi:MAG: hypothetical protein P8186_17440 [Anaerolineae bacterium]|jgi:hypothetical protein
MQVDIQSEDEEPPHNPALNYAVAGDEGTVWNLGVPPGLPQPAPAVGPGGRAPLWGSRQTSR